MLFIKQNIIIEDESNKYLQFIESNWNIWLVQCNLTKF